MNRYDHFTNELLEFNLAELPNYSKVIMTRNNFKIILQLFFIKLEN